MNRLAILLAACLLTINSSAVLAQPEDANIELTEADNDLFNALGDEDSDAATAALKAGANIDAISPRGQQTPLMQSVLHGRLSMVKWCLENGADSTIGERDGYTPMHGAGFQGRVEIAEMLHKHGVALRDKHPGDGHEPIIRSCWGPEERHTATVAWFLGNGVPFDEVYDTCNSMTQNEGTRQLLAGMKGGGDEL